MINYHIPAHHGVQPFCCRRRPFGQERKYGVKVAGRCNSLCVKNATPATLARGAHVPGDPRSRQILCAGVHGGGRHGLGWRGLFERALPSLEKMS